MSVPEGVRAAMLLCDSAQVANGKLYILGGGWSYVRVSEEAPVVIVAIAVDLVIPWDVGNRPLPIVIDLLTEDYEPVINRGETEPIRLEGNVTAGRPPEARAGTDLHVPLALPLPPLYLEPRGYVFQLTVGPEVIQKAAFQVVR
jgi:hypothetical protein